MKFFYEFNSKKEEFYIASVFDKQELCYNLQEKSTSKECSCCSNTPEETSKKLSEVGKAFYSIPKNRIRQSMILKGEQKN